LRRASILLPSHPSADPSRDGTISVLDLAEAPEVPTLEGARFAALAPKDAPALEEAMQASGVYPAGVAAGRYSPERHAYGIWADGMIVSYGWVAYSPEPVGSSGVSFRVKPGDVYIYDCATRPAYQGRGYYKALLRGMAADLHRRGCRRAWIGTEPGNVISQRGILGAGFTKVADVNLIHRVDGRPEPEIYGVPGVPEDLVSRAKWSFIAVDRL
jgi:ribosomal protein S18 acetylase RimI-like enzyme